VTPPEPALILLLHVSTCRTLGEVLAMTDKHLQTRHHGHANEPMSRSLKSLVTHARPMREQSRRGWVNSSRNLPTTGHSHHHGFHSLASLRMRPAPLNQYKITYRECRLAIHGGPHPLTRDPHSNAVRLPEASDQAKPNVTSSRPSHMAMPG
jgi:hypothetical protein